MTTVESLAPIAPPPSRLPNVGTTIFTVMSALAVEKQAVNLGQGFPDFDCDPRIVDAVSDAMRAGLNQYPPMTGVPALRQAIAAKIANLYGHAYDADREITITAGATPSVNSPAPTTSDGMWGDGYPICEASRYPPPPRQAAPRISQSRAKSRKNAGCMLI